MPVLASIARLHFVVCVLGALLSLSLARPASAGTLCGTVRDAATLSPLPGAAIFVFDDLDVYTGLFAASGSEGSWCIEGVPAGTYTVQVRRDDYLLAAVQDVVVVEDVVGIDIVAVTRALLAVPWPNPSSSSVTFRYRVAGDQPLRLEVFDLRGRRVRSWTGTGDGSDRTLQWDFRDARGRPVSTGNYTVVLRAGGTSVMRRVALVR